MDRKTNLKKHHIGTRSMRLAIFIIFAAIIIIADIFLIFDHEKTFSENENRVLTTAPVFSMDSVTSGKFAEQAEDFTSDQFFLRDAWISLKLFIDRISGKVESNGVYLGKEGYLLEVPDEPSEESFTANLDAINAFAGELEGVNIVMTMIPGAECVCDQLLPNDAPCLDETEIIERIKNAVSGSLKFVDVTDALKAHKYEELYYKSDHHWKSLGAKYAFDAMADALDVDASETDYEIMTVTESFSGTLASSSGASYVKDSIEIYVPVTGSAASELSEGAGTGEKAMSTTLEYVVEYVQDNKKSATIYSSAALDTKDKYEVFLGGNYPLINIKTNIDNSRNLLILKDSYANTFIQFLLPYYHTITIVDPRYYSDDLYKLIDENSITDCLILYSENNFVTDNSLAGVLEAE